MVKMQLETFPKSHIKKIIQAFVGLTIGFFFLWLTYQETDWSTVSLLFTNIRYNWLIAGVTFYALDLLARTNRWRIILKPIKLLSIKETGKALLVGYAMNCILPARLGEIFRGNFTGKSYKIPRSTVIGSIFLERVVDGLTIILCILVGGLFIPRNEGVNSLILGASIIFFGLLILSIILSVIARRGFLIKFSATLHQKVQMFTESVRKINFFSLSSIIYLSLLVWMLEGISIWSILKSIDVSLQWSSMLTVLGFISLSTLLPSAPGYVGTYQYAYGLALNLFGYGTEQGIAAATIVQIFIMGSVTLSGLTIYLFTLFNSGEKIK